VLRDGTWSFPVSVNDMLTGAPLPRTPGYIVVRAESPSASAAGTFVYTVGGARPAGADGIAPLGFGFSSGGAGTWALTVGLFAFGLGGLLALSGSMRRRASP
jgi:hypothetical protein